MQSIYKWAVPLVKYTTCIVEWTQEELRKMDINTMKLMTMYRALHLRSCVAHLYLPRKKGSGGLSCVEDWVLKSSTDTWLQLEWRKNVIKVDEESEEHKKRRKA